MGLLDRLGALPGTAQTDPTKPPFVPGTQQEQQSYAVGGGLLSRLAPMPDEMEDLNKSSESVLGYMGKTASRMGGIAAGAAYATPAFIWGSQAAQFEDPEQWSQMGFLAQALVSFGGGFQSALESTFKQGSFGVTYEDYYKIAAGKSIRDDMRDKFEQMGVPDPDLLANQLAPTAVMLAEVVSDTFITMGQAARIAHARVPKGFVGKIPQRVADALDYLDDLTRAEKVRWSKNRISKMIKDYAQDAYKVKESGEYQIWRSQELKRMQGQYGIIEGDTMASTMAERSGIKTFDVRPKPPVGRAPGQIVGGTPTPYVAGRPVAIPSETSGVPSAAQRIMDIAKRRKAQYVADGHLAKRSGVSAMDFFNRARKRLGMPDYMDALAAMSKVESGYGAFGEALMSREVARKPPKDIQAFDLGALVEAAREVFGDDETIKVLRVLEAEDSELGRIVKASLDKIWPESQGISLGVRAVPPKPVVEVAKVPTPPKARRLGVVSKTEPGVKPLEPDIPPVLGETDDLATELSNMGISVSKPEPLIVPGKSFKHVVPKVGEKIPGVGEIVGVVDTPDGKWWIKYIDEGTGKTRLQPLDTVMAKVKPTEPPSITLDIMGFQQMFEKFETRLKAIRARRGRVPFQYQIPDNLLKTPDMGHIVKHRGVRQYKGQLIRAPKVMGLERNVVMNMRELPVLEFHGWWNPKTYKNRFRDLFQNPVRVFEYMGEEAKELFYRPIIEAEHLVVSEWAKVRGEVNALKGTVPRSSRDRIGIYAIAQQRSGVDRLKISGITDIPTLTDSEMSVYKRMRELYEELYNRISAARVMSGKAPFPKVDNYFTFIHDVSQMEKAGVHPVFDGVKKIDKYIQMKTTAFKYAKARAIENEYPLVTDAFRLFETYTPQALRHIHLSPSIAKSRELLGMFHMVDPGTGQVVKWSASQQKPNAFRFIHEWLNYQSGINPESSGFLQGGLIGSAIHALNRHLVYATLSWNVRSALIQPSALRNTYTQIGGKYMWKGIEDLVREAVDPQFVKAVDKSNVLLGRVYDIAVQEAFDAVKSGRIGEMKKLTAKLGMKPLQILDMQTAKITWYGAYRQATEQFGLVGKRAVNYADDVVTKTQSSGTRSNISKIQRFALGRAAALFQTFVINDWNFLVKDVLALGRPEVSQLERFSKITKYIAATTAINIIYEDVLQMNSPYPTPIRVGIEALEAGEDFPSASYRVVRELAEQAPIIGGSIRYGTSPLGGVANIIEQTSEKLAGDKGQPSLLELFARFRGYPGTAQVAKWGRMSKKGEGLWPRLGGKPTIPFSRGTESFGFGEFGDFDTFD